MLIIKFTKSTDKSKGVFLAIVMDIIHNTVPDTEMSQTVSGQAKVMSTDQNQ